MCAQVLEYTNLKCFQKVAVMFGKRWSCTSSLPAKANKERKGFPQSFHFCWHLPKELQASGLNPFSFIS